MKLNDHQFRDLLRTLTLTEDTEINCEQCLATVAAYAESELAGMTLTAASQRVKQHLSVCAECREEYISLLEAIRSLDKRP